MPCSGATQDCMIDICTFWLGDAHTLWCSSVQVPHVTVVHDDIFKLRQLPQLLRTFQSAPGSRLKVVANIPYNITSGKYTVTH